MSSERKKLSGQEKEKLTKAILDAYRDKGSLKMMLSFKLDKNLDEIAGEDNLQLVVFNLIEWAESQGKLKKLIEGACESNSGNKNLQGIRQKFFPRLSDSMNLQHRASIISLQQWKDLCLIIAEINLFILKKVCRITLENHSKFQDVLGNCPELIEPENLGIFKTIFLDKYPKNDRDIPTIIEFAERLTKEREISTNVREQLNLWVKAVAKELNIKLPSYEGRQSSNLTRLNSYLLVTVTPNSSDAFYLQATTNLIN